MELTRRDIARMIDISAVQAYHAEKDVREVVSVARENGFIAVHSLPSWTPLVSELLADRPDIMVGAPVGFPSGGNSIETKLFEAQRLIEDGVQEMDVMLNLGKLKSGDDSYLRTELGSIVSEAQGMSVKVIIETPYLSQDEIIRACELVVESGAAFVKTGTGWSGQSVHMATLQTIVDTVGDGVGVKAAGGIRNLSTLLSMYHLGVRRFGINTKAALSILTECDQRENENER